MQIQPQDLAYFRVGPSLIWAEMCFVLVAGFGGIGMEVPIVSMQ